MEDQNTFYYIISIAAFCLLVGLASYFYLSKNKDNQLFSSGIVISWLLIAIFPAFLISLFFAEAFEASGTIMGFQVGGAFGAFVFTWYFGVRSARKGINVDQLERKVKKLENERREQAIIEASKGNGEKKPTPLTYKETYRYKINAAPKKEIRLITGNITHVDEVDIWVNSENSNMQLARFYDNSISGIIRYMGATRHKISKIVDQDTIYEELMEKLDGILRVEEAAVISTSAGELEKSNNVKKVFHVASSRGELGKGYVPIENIQNCIISCLKEAELPEYKQLKPKSILFPLMGTGTAKRDLQETAKLLLTSAIAFIIDNPDCQIDHVYFLNYTDVDLGLCQIVLNQQDRVTKIG